jgi:hypothetical protein
MPLNLINFTPFVADDGTITPINRLIGTIQNGQAWMKEIQAQEMVVSLLKKLLSDRFTLIRNFTLPNEEVSIPILLVSGGGVWVISVSDATGIFKTQGKELLEIDSKNQDFIPAKANLVMRTLLLSRAFEDFLKKHKVVVPPLESVLIFTNPGVDVTTTGDTGIRVLLSDALSRFATSLMTTPVRVEVGTTKRIVELIKEAHLQSQQKSKNKSGGIKLNFTTNQWIIIGAMILFLGFSVMLLVALFFFA